MRGSKALFSDLKYALLAVEQHHGVYVDTCDHPEITNRYSSQVRNTMISTIKSRPILGSTWLVQAEPQIYRGSKLVVRSK